MSAIIAFDRDYFYLHVSLTDCPFCLIFLLLYAQRSKEEREKEVRKQFSALPPASIFSSSLASNANVTPVDFDPLEVTPHTWMCINTYANTHIYTTYTQTQTFTYIDMHKHTNRHTHTHAHTRNPSTYMHHIALDLFHIGPHVICVVIVIVCSFHILMLLCCRLRDKCHSLMESCLPPLSPLSC